MSTVILQTVNAELGIIFSLFQCGDPFRAEDVVLLNGTREDVEKLKERMEEKRAKAKTKVSFQMQSLYLNPTPTEDLCPVQASSNLEALLDTIISANSASRL